MKKRKERCPECSGILLPDIGPNGDKIYICNDCGKDFFQEVVHATIPPADSKEESYTDIIKDLVEIMESQFQALDTINKNMELINRKVNAIVNSNHGIKAEEPIDMVQYAKKTLGIKDEESEEEK